MEFLNAQKKSTRFTYNSYIQQYLEFAQKSGSELLEAKRQAKEGEIENSMFVFRKWLLEKGYSEHYAKSCIGCVRGFYGYHRMPLVFRKTEAKKLKEASRKTEDYLFDREDLGKMALVGNLKEKYVLLVGKSVGLRASDFLAFTYGKFRSLKLDSDAPIFIGETYTTKEKIPAYPFLDSDAVPIVKAILEANPQAKDSDRILTDTEENLSVILQNLAKKSGIEPHGKRIRFHCLRKYLIDRLSAYASESQWKQIVGKKIEEKAYVSSEQLKGIFKRAMKDLAINGNGHKTRKIIELETALQQLENENIGLKTRIDELQKRLEETNNSMKRMFTDLSNDIIRIEKRLKIKQTVKID